MTLLRIFPHFLLFVVLSATAFATSGETGADIRAIFAKASAGTPIRAVAIGGSITQAGGGWIGPWLKRTFPESTVVMRNAGMSATGSDLAMFRLERDVINTQPDLVLFEFVVNDGGRSEESVIWSVESCIRSLKSLPNPPAIIMLEAAQRSRMPDVIPPQRKVAEHYGIVSIDLNSAVRTKLEKENMKWEDLLSDEVHMNERGNAFYAEQISSALEKYLGGKSESSTPSFPAQLSKLPLISDGALSSVPLAEGWVKEQSVKGWWNMFFLGAVSCKTPGKVLEIPFRGTAVGIFYALDESYGVLYAGVDGAKPVLIPCNNRKGYGYAILGRDLAPTEHVLRIVVPEDGAGAEGVKLGYVMTGGDINALITTRHEKGDYDAPRMATLKVGAIGGYSWVWVGPFGDVSKPWASDKALPNLSEVFWPEGNFENGAPGKKTPDDPGWRKIENNPTAINFTALTGLKDRGICYAWTVIESEEEINLDCEISIDYWGKIWVGGKMAVEIRDRSGSPVKPIPFKMPLKAGKNDVLVKVHPGSGGCMFSLRVPERPDTVRFTNPLE